MGEKIRYKGTMASKKKQSSASASQGLHIDEFAIISRILFVLYTSFISFLLVHAGKHVTNWWSLRSAGASLDGEISLVTRLVWNFNIVTLPLVVGLSVLGFILWKIQRRRLLFISLFLFIATTYWSHLYATTAPLLRTMIGGKTYQLTVPPCTMK